MTTKKKILITLLSAAGVCVVGSGVVYGVKSAQKSEVMVVPVSDINNGGYWGDNMSMEGIVTSDVSQDVYLTDIQTVDQVKVKEGDAVNEGDILLTYDMTLTNLNLEMQKLSRDQVDLRIQVAQNDLKKLKNTKPVSDSPGGSDGDFGPMEPADPDTDPGTSTPDPTPTPKPTPTPPTYDKAEVFNGSDNPLDYEAFTNNEYFTGEGKKDDPFRFLCQEGTIVKASFVNAMMGFSYDENGTMGERTEAGFYYQLEVRKDNKAVGELIKAWKQNGATLETPCEDGWEAVLDLKDNSNDIKGSAAGGMKNYGAANLTMKSTGKIIFTDTTPANKDKGGSFSGNTSPDPDRTYTKEELAEAIKEKEKEIKNLELDLREQNIKLKATEKAVSEGQVVAKINGIVKKVGDPKNPPKDGSPFMTVSSTDGMFVKGTVSELKLDQIEEGITVNIMSYQSGVMCEATIKDVSPYPVENFYDYTGASASGYPFTAYIASGGEELQNNEYVDVSLSQQPEGGDMMGSDAISMSKAFIREEDGVKFVYLRGEDGRLKKQEVITGRIFWGDTYEIMSGITQEDWIAFPYGKNVKEGAKTKEGNMNQLYGY